MATASETSVTLDTNSSVTITPKTLENEPQTTINVGTRKSLLARVQTDIVIGELKKTHPKHNYVVHAISTMGDKNQVTALHDFGAKSLWTYELEAMLLAGEVDFIVHSLKDIPTQLPAACALGAILSREDPRDAMCLSPRLPPTTTLRSLPEGSIIGTSSVRRTAQLARLYPHLKFQSVRGNLGTRLSKLDAEDSPYSALILAAAGLIRIDLGHRITALLSSKNEDGGIIEESTDNAREETRSKPWGMLHAVGQGALGIEMRLGDERIASLLKPVNCPWTSLACLAERSLMRTLEGGCSVPIGVETEWASDGVDAATPADSSDPKLIMRATVVSVTGDAAACATFTAPMKMEEDADEFGRTVASMLVKEGAGKILGKINLNRDVIENEGGGA